MIQHATATSLPPREELQLQARSRLVCQHLLGRTVGDLRQLVSCRLRVIANAQVASAIPAEWQVQRVPGVERNTSRLAVNG